MVSLLTGVIFGLVPAIRMARADAEGALRETARNAAGGRPRHVSRRALVVAQVALSAVLLIGAALMIRSVLNLHGLDRGYREDNALSLSLLLPQTRLPEASRRQQFFDTVIERLRVLPGVTDVGGVTLLSSRGRPFAADGQAASAGLAPTAVFRAASPDYLRAIGIPLARGRHFTAADDSAAPAVAIVNETLTRSVWPDVDPIGQRLRLLDSDVDAVLTVVGVAGDVKESLDPRYPLRLDPRPTIYRPAAQQAIVSMTLIVRTGPDPLSLAAAVRREIAAVDSSIPVLALRSVRQGVMESIATPRFNADAAPVLRRDRAAARVGRPLRRCGLWSEAAHARDRHSHGARRRARNRVARRRRGGAGARGDWRRRGHGWRVRRGAPHRELSLRRAAEPIRSRSS